LAAGAPRASPRREPAAAKRRGRGRDDSLRPRRHPGRIGVLYELRSTRVRPHTASGPSTSPLDAVDLLFLPLMSILTVLGLIAAFVWIRGTLRQVESRADILPLGVLSFAATFVLLTFATNLLLLGSAPHIALSVGLLVAVAVTGAVVVLSRRRVSSARDTASNNRSRGP
jgi:hypothetical protein